MRFRRKPDVPTFAEEVDACESDSDFVEKRAELRELVDRITGYDADGYIVRYPTGKKGNEEVSFVREGELLQIVSFDQHAPFPKILSISNVSEETPAVYTGNAHDPVDLESRFLSVAQLREIDEWLTEKIDPATGRVSGFIGQSRIAL